jgi:P4 family phage/plasmid primase-like protien
MRPSLIGNSGHGIHAYWKIKTPIDRKTWENLENSLIRFAKSKLERFNPDTSVKDWARILRILGTVNVKAEPVGSHIVIEDYSEYSLEFLKRFLPTSVSKKEEEKKAVIRPEEKKDTLPCPSLKGIMGGVKRGWRHPGQFAIAVFGWNNGWSYEEVKAATLNFNDKCDPKKSEAEVLCNLDVNWRSFERGNVKEIGCKSDGLFSSLLNEFCPYKSNKAFCEWMHPKGMAPDEDAKEENETTRMINQIVETVRRKYHFKTTKDNDTIYVYVDGVYKPEGEIVISEEAENILGKHLRINTAREAIAQIKYSTYVDRKEFDSNPYLLCLKNGIFNIKTKELLQHNPDILLTSQMPITFDKDAECPKVKEFLDEIVYPDDIPFIQEYFGFSLFRDYFIRKAMLMYGNGGNGKSTLLALFEKFIGGADGKNISHVSMKKLAFDRFAGADMHGKYLNIFDELEQDAVMNTSLFKQATGGSTIRAEFKGRNAFDYVPFAKHIFTCNQIPDVKDSSDAFFERLNIITFPYKFEVNPDPENANEKKRRMREEIMAEITTEEEMSGLFNWALEGLFRLFERKEFTGTKSTEETKKEFMLKSTPVNAFIEEMVEFLSDSELPKKDAYVEYVKFCQRKKLPAKGYQNFCQNFFESLAGKIVESRPRDGDQRKMVWLGIKIKPDEAEAGADDIDDEQTILGEDEI